MSNGRQRKKEPFKEILDEMKQIDKKMKELQKRARY